MNKRIPRKLVVLVSIFIVVLSLSSCGQPSSGTGSVQKLKAVLEKDGFTVQEGKLETFDIVKMADLGLVPMCWGNNPSTPYMVYKLPPAPGQTSRNNVTDEAVNPANKGLWTDFKLRQDEALLFVGNTPPGCDYFSYRSYQAGTWIPEVGGLRRTFASLGDTLNNMTIKTGGSGTTMNSPTMIITTADEGINQRVHEAAVSSGYSKDIINDDIISPHLVEIGLDPEDDAFAFIHRTAFFKDKKSADAYYAKPQGTVLRLTPKVPVKDFKPHSVPDLRVRGTGDASELDLLPDMEQLRQAILEKNKGHKATELKTGVWLPEGYYAIQRKQDVIGENRDTTYLSTDQFTLGDDPNEYLIVYGVNHAAMEKATYCNFGIYGAKLVNGVGAVSNHDFTGTAEEYLPNNPNAKKLYVWKVARQAEGDPKCMEVPSSVGAAGIDLNEPCFVGYRAYLEPKTKVGPFWSELVLDRAIKFDPEPQ